MQAQVMPCSSRRENSPSHAVSFLQLSHSCTPQAEKGAVNQTDSRRAWQDMMPTAPCLLARPDVGADTALEPRVTLH